VNTHVGNMQHLCILYRSAPGGNKLRGQFVVKTNNMKKTIGVILVLAVTLVSFAQPFEGEIIYKNVYKSKVPAISDDQFNAMMGTVQEYYIKDGNYKSVANGSMFQWQLYINTANKLYTKSSNTETIIWNDVSVNPDTVLQSDIKKEVTTILGYVCDELVLTCKSGVQKYYFSSKLPAETRLFANHKFGNWHDFLLQANALPLKTIIETPQFVLESVATEVKPMKLEKTFFELPAGAKTMKSPY